MSFFRFLKTVVRVLTVVLQVVVNVLAAYDAAHVDPTRA